MASHGFYRLSAALVGGIVVVGAAALYLGRAAAPEPVAGPVAAPEPAAVVAEVAGGFTRRLGDADLADLADRERTPATDPPPRLPPRAAERTPGDHERTDPAREQPPRSAFPTADVARPGPARSLSRPGREAAPPSPAEPD